MKKVKIAFAALAVFTAITTMSFTTKETKVQDNDCWSTIQRHQTALPADLNQVDDCPGQDGICCVKPNSSAPTGYNQYGFPEL